MEALTFTLEAIGTHFWFELYCNEEQLNQIKTKSVEMLTEFEELYSRFKPTSLIGQLNQGLEVKPTAELYSILEYAESIHQWSSGYFDIFAGQILNQLGYDSNYTFVSNASSDYHFVRGFEIFSPDKIRLANNSAIDLGGLGKGYVLDKLREICLSVEDIVKGFINGGGDIVTWNELDNQKFRFYLQNPLQIDEYIGYIDCEGTSSLASSNGHYRQWQDRRTGGKLHHLINPHDKSPANSLTGTFTCGKLAIETDIASTILFVSGGLLGEEVHQSYPNVSFSLVDKKGLSKSFYGYPAHFFE